MIIQHLKHLMFVLFVLMALVGIVLYGAGNTGGIFLVTSSLMVCVFVAPFVFGVMSFDPFSPLALATGALLLGTGFRVPYILFSNEDRADFLMFGSEFSTLVGYNILMLIAAVFFVMGYLASRKRVSLRFLPMSRSDLRLSGNLLIFTAIFAVVGSFSAFVFLKSSGVDLSKGLLSASRKIYVMHTLDDGSQVAGTGGLPRFLVGFSEVPLIILFGLLIAQKIRLTPVIAILIALLSIPVFLTPFLTSSRSLIVLVLIKVAIIAFYYDKLKARHVGIGLVLVVVVVTFMGNLRQVNMAGLEEGRSVIGTVVGSGNGLDIVRTAGIMDRVPEVTPHLYGSSYAASLVFYVPRSVWPGKPDVALGPWVKETVFGHPVPGNNGWPSGMIAEAYINFGVVGVPPIMFLFGLFLRLVYNSFRPFLGVSLAMTVLYAIFAWRLGFGMIGLNFAHSLSQILVAVFPVLMFYFLCSKRASSPQQQVAY